MLLSEMVGLLDSWYDPAWAEPWDKVGLVCGDPDQEVAGSSSRSTRSRRWSTRPWTYGADLLVVHHPLLLTPVSSVAATTAKGRVCTGWCATASRCSPRTPTPTCPADGVNDAIARALGLEDAEVLAARPTAAALDKLVVFVPHRRTPRRSATR